MKRFFALISAVALLLSGCAARIDKTSELLQYKDKDKIARIEALCADFFETSGTPGLSVGVLVDGKVRFFSYGVTAEGGGKITEDTRFDLGSLSEILTGITYSESIYRRYLSDFSEVSKIFPILNVPQWSDGTAITYGQLATHRSGMPQTPDNLPGGDRPYAEYSEQDLRKFISGASLINRPGAVYSPGGIDMGLLGFAVETARKVPFESHTKSVIMYCIGMTRTTITMPEDDTTSRAVPHSLEGEALEHLEYASLQGMAGFKSTAYDLILLAWCHMNMPGTEDTFTKAEAGGMPISDQLYLSTAEPENKAAILKIIGAQSVMERLHASMAIARDEHYSDGQVRLGYGYKIGEMFGQDYYWQTGGFEGGSGYFGILPGSVSGVVVLANSPVDTQSLGESIFEVLN